MAANEEASPICRGKNLSWETVMLFFNYMPKEPMIKEKFNAFVEKNINSWTQTHSQIARQLAFYYEENGICYPRFCHASTLADLFAYMVHWAHNYFIPNPYSPSLKGQSPTSIYSHLIKCINSGNINYDNALDSIFDIPLSSHDKVRIFLQNYTNIKFDNDNISINPNIVDETTLLKPSALEAVDTKAYYMYFNKEVKVSNKIITSSLGKRSLQQIYYGAPGTGKSHTINDITKKEDVIRTTFHPDTDYSTFVGAYKPTTIEETVMTVIGKEAVPVRDTNGEEYKESKIIYEFVPQAFLQAYIAAWKKYANSENNEPRKQYLVIEEINRGNCAQIFGDLFQLLDRNDNGFSEYPIKADTDMKNQLQKAFKGLNIPQKDSINEIFKEHCDDIVKEVLEGDSLLLPNNLYIWATMNTSDQSLFPIDSAFKRRWDWQYIPISNAHKNWKIKVGDNYYDWWQFIETINALIGKITNSEDKKLGYFFCKADANNNIKADRFVGKVLFYLWNDVFKDYDFCDPVFNDADGNKITFDKFYTAEGNDSKIVEEQVELFLKNLHLNPVENDGEEDLDSEDVEDKNGRDTTHYSINGEGDFPKLLLAKELIERFVKMHPELSAEDVIRQWKGLSTVSHFIENDNEHERRTEDGKKRTQAVTCNDGTLVWVSTNGWDLNTVKALIEEVNSKEDWGLQVKAIE